MKDGINKPKNIFFHRLLYSRLPRVLAGVRRPATDLAPLEAGATRPATLVCTCLTTYDHYMHL